MTQEEKQLLLIDLCGRLPYGVICYDEVQKEAGIFKQFEYEGFGRIHNGRGLRFVENIKPYLRPMSSMTEDEKDEMFGICTLSNCSINSNWECVGVEVMSSHPRYGDYYSTDYKVIDWLNAHHFDYRGLIEKGLALEAPEGMYDLK